MPSLEVAADDAIEIDAAPWHRITTPHFALFGDVPARTLRGLAVDLEALESLLGALNPDQVGPLAAGAGDRVRERPDLLALRAAHRGRAAGSRLRLLPQPSARRLRGGERCGGARGASRPVPRGAPSLRAPPPARSAAVAQRGSRRVLQHARGGARRGLGRTTGGGPRGAPAAWAAAAAGGPVGDRDRCSRGGRHGPGERFLRRVVGAGALPAGSRGRWTGGSGALRRSPS